MGTLECDQTKCLAPRVDGKHGSRARRAVREVLRLRDDSTCGYSRISSRLIVVDDFYDEPDHVRDEIVNSHSWSTFSSQVEGPIGMSTAGARYRSVIVEKLRRLLDAEPHVADHYFRLTTSSAISPFHIHRDYTLNVLVYLAHPMGEPGGTMFLSPTKSNARLSEQLASRFDLNRWGVDALVPFKYNRCLIFDGMIPHSRLNSFGSQPTDGRLTQHVWLKQVGERELCRSNREFTRSCQLRNGEMATSLNEVQRRKVGEVFGAPCLGKGRARR
jgi:hypothetical protein